MAFLLQRSGSKNWYVKYHTGKGWAWQSTGTTDRDQAEEELKKFDAKELLYRAGEIEYQPKAPPKPSRKITLKEAVQLYFDHIEGRQSPVWIRCKKGILAMIMRHFGENTPVSSIKRDSLERYQRLRTAGKFLPGYQPVSNRTCNVDTNCIMALMRFLHERGMLMQIPKIKKLPEEQGRLVYLSAEQRDRLIDEAGKVSLAMKCHVALMCYAGLRVGEVHALRWKDVDTAQRRIDILNRADWKTKTRKGRSVPMRDELYAILVEKMVDVDPEELIVKDPNLTLEMLERGFRSVAESAGLPTRGEDKVTNHTCRHTFASLLAQRGVDLHTIGQLLGHSNPSTTQIYAHLGMESKRRAIDLSD